MELVIGATVATVAWSGIQNMDTLRHIAIDIAGIGSIFLLSLMRITAVKYTVTKQRVQVIGYIWQPGAGLCAQTRDLDRYDMSNIENPADRSSVEHYIGLNFGDFSEILDWSADFDIDGLHIEHPWLDEDSEWKFYDCMYGMEE